MSGNVHILGAVLGAVLLFQAGRKGDAFGSVGEMLSTTERKWGHWCKGLHMQPVTTGDCCQQMNRTLTISHKNGQAATKCTYWVRRCLLATVIALVNGQERCQGMAPASHLVSGCAIVSMTIIFLLWWKFDVKTLDATWQVLDTSGYSEVMVLLVRNGEMLIVYNWCM